MAKKSAPKPVKSGKSAPKKSPVVKAEKAAEKPVKASTKPPAKPSVMTAKAKAPPKEAKLAQATESIEKIKIDKEQMTDDQIKWAEMYNKHKDSVASPYDMKLSFKAGTAIQHKVLGWGWIVSNENDRLEVYFKDGKRMLISHYKG